ncbi:MAG: hypothetical protein ALAOOOJD_02641 [bacterium]|nr:hypothetical protein [bacterium]
MKRILLILAAVSVVALPIWVIAQSQAPRDTTKSQSAKQKADRQKALAERAKRDAEKEKLRGKRHARIKAHLAGDAWAWDELAVAEPAVAEALEMVEPAMEAARAAMENIDFAEINMAMQDASENLARVAPFVDMPPIPPIAALAPFPELPPIPDIPPIPAIPPIPDIALGAGMSFGQGWSWGGRAYAKNLSDEEQIRLQALSALLHQDENAALPEIKSMARQNENWAMRASAVALLAHVESAEVIPILDEVLNKDTDQRVRKAAVRALSQRDEPAAREALKRLLLK